MHGFWSGSMTKILYPLCISTWDTSEKEAMIKVIESGRFTQGPLVQKFEQEFAKNVGSKYACLVNSGSSANLLAIAALFCRKNKPLKRGDEVIVPAVSWSTTYAPLQQFGLHVKFVDVDLKTLNMCPKSLEKNISSKTKLVFAVNLLGNPIEVNKIKNILSKQKNPPVLLEDNCESMGASYKGKQMGTHGLLGTYSMFYSHHISTMEGGVIVTDSEQLYQILLSLRAHGWTREIPTNNALNVQKNEDHFYDSYNFIYPGYNVRSGELNGAIGLEQLTKLETFIAQRRKNAQIFLKVCRKFEKWLMPQQEVEQSSWFSFAVICNENTNRQNLIQALSKAGIETRPIVAGNFTKNSVIDFFDYSIGKDGLKNADLIHTNGFTVGNHHIPMKDMINHLEKTLTEYFEGRYE